MKFTAILVAAAMTACTDAAEGVTKIPDWAKQTGMKIKDGGSLLAQKIKDQGLPLATAFFFGVGQGKDGSSNVMLTSFFKGHGPTSVENPAYSVLLGGQSNVVRKKLAVNV